jgi:hypothetical protein
MYGPGRDFDCDSVRRTAAGEISGNGNRQRFSAKIVGFDFER